MTNQSQAQDTTRVLLALWDLGGTEVKRGDLRPRIVRKGEKSSQYEDIFQKLEQTGAIAQSKTTISLCQPKGLEMLSAGLQDPEFIFTGAIMGTKTANALLRWIREMGNQAVVAAPAMTNGKATTTAIESYGDFQKVALEVYDRLNRDYNLDDLVPIYRIRRAIGDRVARSNFDEWLLEMQATDIFQLLEGSVEDSAPDKIEDSITTKVSGLRCYAKRLTK